MDLRYPIGRAELAKSLDAGRRQQAIDSIAMVPRLLRGAVRGMTDTQLDTPYRPDGWTVRQVVHHIPDSHMNAYIRFKLALTEEAPPIKPYDEAAWARLEDSRTTPIETSLVLLESLHDRWVRVLRAMSEADFARTLTHPERGEMTLDEMLCLYEWHGKHHLAHIVSLAERSGW